MNAKRPGLDDPYDWIRWWTSLHRSESFIRELAALVLTALEDPSFVEGPSSYVIEVDDAVATISVVIEAIVEQFPKGRIFHVVRIWSDGDQLPPWLLDRNG